MKGKVFHISPKPGMEVKRPRRKKCPDEYMELPPPPKLYEADPDMLADIDEVGRRFAESIEKYREKMPSWWFETVTNMASARYAVSAINVANETLLKEAEAQVTQIKMGLKLVKH